MIDPRLRSLQMVAWHGTVTQAASTLNYTPSAVSAQLRSLAADVGLTLLVRQGRTVQLTSAGQLLVEQAEALHAQWERMHAELLHASDRVPAALRLSGFSTAAAALLPPVASAVMAAHPGTDVRIIEADPRQCFELLLAERADLAVVVTTSDLPGSADSRFEQRPLLEDPLDLLVHVEHHLAGRSEVPLAQTADEAWIMDRPGRPYHQLVLTACLAAGFNPRQAHEVVEWEAGAALVGAGLGVALVPRLARLPAGYDVVRVPLRGDPRPTRQVRTGVRAGGADSPLVARALSELDRLVGVDDLGAGGWMI